MNQRLSSIELHDTECLSHFPGSAEYFRYLDLINKLQNVDGLSLDECQRIGKGMVVDYINQDPAAALYAEAVENPDRFRASTPENEKPMTHLAVYGVCSLPKLKDLNAALGPAVADQFMAELRENVIGIVRESGVLFSLPDCDIDIFSSDHSKGLVLHYPLVGGEYTEERIRELNRDIAQKTKEALLELVKKYAKPELKEAISKRRDLEKLMRKYRDSTDFSETAIQELEQNALHKPGLKKYDRDQMLNRVRVFRELQSIVSEYRVLEAKAKYLGILYTDAEDNKGVSFLFGVSRIEFEGQNNEQMFLEANIVVGDSIRGAKQAANRKDTFKKGVSTGAYSILTTQSHRIIGTEASVVAEVKDPSDEDKRDDTQLYSQTWYIRDLLGARAALISHLNLSSEAIEGLNLPAECALLFTRNEKGDLILTKKGAEILRKYDSFKQTSEYRNVDATVLDALVEQDWFNVIEFADHLKMVQLPFTDHYRQRIDSLLWLKKQLAEAKSDKEARTTLKEIEAEFAISHKCEPDDKALTVYGRLKKMLAAGRGIGFLADAVGLGARNKIVYDENSLKIVNLCLDIIRSDLPAKEEQYLAILDSIPLPKLKDDDPAKVAKVAADIEKAKAVIAAISNDPHGISSDEIVKLFDQSYVCNQFFRRWYPDHVSDEVKEEIKGISLEGCDRVTAELKKEVHDLCGEVFTEGYRQKGDEIEGVNAIDSGETGDSYLAEDLLLRYFAYCRIEGKNVTLFDLNGNDFQFPIPESPTHTELVNFGRSLHQSFRVFIDEFLSVDSDDDDDDYGEVYDDDLGDGQDVKKNQVIDFEYAKFLRPQSAAYCTTLAKAFLTLHGRDFPLNEIPTFESEPGWLEGLYLGTAESLAAEKTAEELEAKIREDLASKKTTAFRVNLVQHDIPIEELIREDYSRRALAIALSVVDDRAEGSFNRLKGYTNIGEVPPEQERIVEVHSLKDILGEMGLNTDFSQTIRYKDAS